MIECNCEKFETGMKAINGPITLQSVRSGGKYQFNQEYVFRFCPWCGKQLSSKEQKNDNQNV